MCLSIAGSLDAPAWQRLSAGEGTKGARLYDWAYLELADLDAAEFNKALSGTWTRGLLIRRSLADGKLAFFTTWCSAGTGAAKLVQVWQLVILPAEPVYCRPTPHDDLPCLRKPVSSITSTASGSANVSSAYSRTTSRITSASHRPRPWMACWRYGPGSSAASACIQPVLRCSGPSKPSRNSPADCATCACVNNGRIRPLTSRNDDAHNSSVASIEAPDIPRTPNCQDIPRSRQDPKILR